MNEREKKITIICAISLFVASMVVVSGLWLTGIIVEIYENGKLNNLFSWIFANFGTTGLSIMFKILINKKHIKEVKSIVPAKVIKEKEKIMFKGFEFTKDKQDNLVIKDTKNRPEIDKLNALTNAVASYVDLMKKKI